MGDILATVNTTPHSCALRGRKTIHSLRSLALAAAFAAALTTAHAQGRAHEFTADEARIAGRKGGEAVSRDRAHMAAIGRAGGQARGRNRAQSVAGLSSIDADTVARSANAAE